MLKGQCKANWETPDNPPKYDNQMYGKPFVHVLILCQGVVFNGHYTDGEWFILGAESCKEFIDGWCYYPEI